MITLDRSDINDELLHAPGRRATEHHSVSRSGEGYWHASCTCMLRMSQLESRSAVAFVAAAALLTGIGLARQRAMEAGFHVVPLPTGGQASERVETRVLLETAHLKLASVSIPRGACCHLTRRRTP